ncbi:hypothetical protein QBC36DRAFT_389196 [Triangularia setosa]|uniref:Uncharacterized protein n=1 Tax=Triangularia setosa TaxID=2587417 RepID=A0AAN7A6H5_9PEZI|nr:hypothetical protein QBC36DRAFT_389196 [Podospora setosa]
MAGSVLALSLLGLGAVQAAPSAPSVETRQIWIGDGGGVFWPGPDQPIAPCLANGADAPQAPCLLPPIPGDGALPPGFYLPPKDKRDAESLDKRQIWIGDAGSEFIPGQGPLKPCLVTIPLKGQPPCLLGPILTWPKNKRGVEARQTLIIGGPPGSVNPGLPGGGMPVCLPFPPKEKREAEAPKPPKLTLPPDYATNTKKVIEQLEARLIVLQNKKYKTKQDIELIKDLKEALFYLAGITSISAPPGTGTSFTPGKRSDDVFQLLPPDYVTNTKRVIETLQKELIILQNKRRKTKDDIAKIQAIKDALLYLAGITHISAPPGSSSTFTPGKRDTFKLPPDATTNPKRVIEQLETELIALQNKKNKTKADYDLIADYKAALLYLAGITNISAPPGSGSTFTPGKRDVLFKLPPDAATNPKKFIVQIEKDLVILQNKKNKSKADLELITAYKAALQYLAGITNISAPPGTGTSFTPGKRDVLFKLPPDAATNPKKFIVQIEKDLVILQNKKNKTKEDHQLIAAYKAALRYLAGITNISAPPGSETSFTPGKRSAEVDVNAVGAFEKLCPNIKGAQDALKQLLLKGQLSVEEIVVVRALVNFLKGCGFEPGEIPTPGPILTNPKRDSPVLSAGFELAGLEKAYKELLTTAQLATSAGQPSFANWIALSTIADILELYGVKVDRSLHALSPLPKRQADSITIGGKTCKVIDILGLRAALAALQIAYGEDITKAPTTIFLIQQVLVTALQLCGQTVPGWTTIVPGNPIPGGPIVPQPTVPGGPLVPGPYVPGAPVVPQPTVPGGPLVPEPYAPGAPVVPEPYVPGSPVVPQPTVPGGPIKPSDKRQAPGLSNATDLLAALNILEKAYGTYGSGTIPVPVWLIMVNLVTILQTIPGTVVPGWPVLGQGSVVLTPSP